MPAFSIAPLSDPTRLRAFLAADPDYAAYALGDLEPPYTRYTSWIAACDPGGQIAGLALIYSALEPPVLFLMGSPAAVEALLQEGIGPPQVFFTARPADENALRCFFTVESLYQMHRMRVTPESFTPPAAKTSLRAVALSSSHLPDILRLIDETSRHDSRDRRDIAFDPAMLTDGYYRGIFRKGTLAAMAGTHIVARAARLAALGNVIVHPAQRRQGLGLGVSAAVTGALLASGLERVVLNVRQDNTAAIRIYERLGYQRVLPFIEGLANRR